MRNYLEQALNDEVRYWINHNLKNYLEKKNVVENQSEIEHIIDFLNSDQAPPRLRKMSYKEANESAKRWLKTLVKKGADLEEVEDVDYEVILDFNDGYKLVRLKSELSFKREGYLMGHCVSSYFGRGGSIYSLRDSKDMPHATLEIPEGASSVHQCKGKGNGPIHHKYISYIIYSLKHFDIDIRPSEMNYLGYFHPESSGADKDQIEWFKDSFKHLETFSYKGNKYYFVG